MDANASSVDLWRRWQTARDGDAFAALVRPELPTALAVARGAGCDAGAADDAVQEALVLLARAPGDAPLALGVRTWFLRAVRDRARSALRGERRRRARERVAARPESRPASAALEAVELVERALASLDADEREAVRLRHALDLDYGDVAAVLGTTEATARVRVHRALARLRARLGRDPTTLLALLPLPVAVHAHAWVGAALAQAAGAGVAGVAGAAAGAGTGAGIAAGTGGVAMGSGKTLAAIGVLAFAGGMVATAVVRDRSEPPTPPVERPAAVAEPTAPETPRERVHVREETPRDETAAFRGPWIDDLRPTDAERAWLREALVAERTRRAEAQIRPDDSGVDVLRRYLDFDADVASVLASYETAAAHVPAGTGTPVHVAAPREGESPDLTQAAGASIVEFGPGRFDLRRTRTGPWDRQSMPARLEIRGAGRDATTLVLGRSQEFMLLGDGRSVVLRDLTIECPDADVTPFDVRGGASFAFENVRFAGWLSGAGYSSVLGIAGRGFVACRDCEFLAGGDGFVLALRGPGLAVFERCTFADTYSVFIGGGGGSGGRPSVVRVRDCTFRSTRLADSRLRNGSDDDVDLRVTGGRAEFGSAAQQDDVRRKAWGSELAREIDGVEFAPEIPAFSGEDLARVLRDAESRGWHPVVAATPLLALRGRPPLVDLFVAEGGSLRRISAEFAQGSAPRERAVRSGAMWTDPASAQAAAGLQSLRALLTSVSELGQTALDSALFRSKQEDGRVRWTAEFHLRGGGTYVLDAITGELISPRVR
mgnify:CR=1 FL=1